MAAAATGIQHLSIWLLICMLLPLAANGHYMFSLVRYFAIPFPAFVALRAWRTLDCGWHAGGRSRADGPRSASSVGDDPVPVLAPL
jgi:hypothetical protein